MFESSHVGVGLFISAIMLIMSSKQRLPRPKSSVYMKSDRIKLIETLVQQDEGKRGIAQIIPIFPIFQAATAEEEQSQSRPQSHLENAAQAMLDCSHAVIITGFPCMLDHSPPTETDGPLGAMCLARTLVAMGKKVHVITDECNEDVMLACAASSGVFAMGQDQDEGGLPLLELESFPPMPLFTEDDAYRLHCIGEEADLIIAIERAGPSADGRYLTMNARDMTSIIAPLDELLQPAGSATAFDDSSMMMMATMARSEEEEEEDEVEGDWDHRNNSSKTDQCRKRRVVSIGIGDGGNEVGMGALYHTIIQSTIPRAAEIACVVPTDHILVASVSNWGGYALAASTALLGNVSINQCLPSEEVELLMCHSMVNAGARDGVTGELKAWVDGMPIETSLEVLRNIKKIANFGSL